MQYHITDDAKEHIIPLLKERFPWLLLGLGGGILATIIVSKFENVLSANLSLAFFFPVIVYLADAIGTQTENIYVRNLSKFKDNFFKYLFKEILVGLTFGLIFGIILGLFAKYWLGSDQIGFTVGVAMFINGTIAPIVALSVSELLFKERSDPALGAGPFTTVIQDLLSILIYLTVAFLVIL